MEPIEQKKGPWTVKASQVKYQNPWIKVLEDQVIRPDGTDGIFGTVTIKPGVSVLPLDENNNVYLIEEYHYSLERREMLIPTGGIDEGETPLEAAKRELEEEAGLVAASWTDLGMFNPLTMFIDCPLYLFLAQDLKETATNHEGGEQIKVLKMPFAEAFQLISDGKITHAQTIIEFYKVKERLDI